MDYYSQQGISQSTLKRFLNPNPRSLFRSKEPEEDYYYYKEKIYFSKGKLLDMLMEDRLDITDYFYVEEEWEHPSDVVESISQQVYDEGAIDNWTRVLEIIKEHKYQSRWKESTIAKWVSETLVGLVIRKEQIGARTVITRDEFDVIALIADKIKTGPFTSQIMDEYPGHYQVAIYHEGKKALIDYLQLDHDKKVARVIDFKTTYEYLEYFPGQIKKYRLDIQLSWYSYLVSLKYPDYKILDPVLIVGSTAEPEWPEPFTLTPKVLMAARFGFTDRKGRYYPGWQELLFKLESYNHELYNSDLMNQGTNIINEL